jgi:spoIIIJ-associated protein
MNAKQSIDFAKKYLEDTISFFGINADVEVSVHDEVIELSVSSTELNSILIGKNAETLRSLQYIISTTLRNKDAELSRVNVDIGGYKKQRAEKIAAQAREWIAEVRRTGDTFVGDLNAADRRIVHHVASEYEDIHSFSEGEGRERRIIIAQKSS